MEKTTLYLPLELQRALREAARQEGRSQADVVRDALGQYLRERRRPRLRSLGVGEDADLAARDSEAWLESQWASPADR